MSALLTQEEEKVDLTPLNARKNQDVVKDNSAQVQSDLLISVFPISLQVAQKIYSLSLESRSHVNVLSYVGADLKLKFY